MVKPTRAPRAEDEAETIGHRIRDLRRLRGMTIDQLSAATGSSVGFISQLENRPDKSLSIERIEAFARALGVCELSLLPAWRAPDMCDEDTRFVRRFLTLPADKKRTFYELMDWYVRGRKG